MEKKSTKKLVPYKAPSIAAFKKMSPAQKRITIAKDIIAAVNGKIYVANQGTYIKDIQIEGNRYHVWYDSATIAKWDIQQTLPKVKECQVCAMGACIMSITKYENKLKFGDIGRIVDEVSTDTTDLIKNVFPPKQLCMIEVMFEGEYRPSYQNLAGKRYDVSLSEQEAKECIKFSRRFSNVNNRMKAIMTHIIENKGEVVSSNMNKKRNK